MKLTKNWKRIFAGFMAGIMLFLSVDAGSMAAFAVEKEENLLTGRVPVELIPVDMDSIEGDVYDYKELAELQTFSLVYNNEWDKYSTNLYYNQLSTKMRTIWDALDAVCLEYLLNEKDAMEQVLEDDIYYCLDMVSLSKEDEIKTGDLELLFELFLNSNPQYYFLNNQFLVAGEKESEYLTGFAVCIYYAFVNGANRADATADVKKEIESVLSAEKIAANASEAEKLRYVHDYIVNKVAYDTEITADGEISTEEDERTFSQSAYSVLCKNSTVCAGYAEALALLCNGLGVDASTVTSDDHMWNKVRIDDSWYNIDATWADQNVTLYNYYGRSDEVYDNDADEASRKSHTEMELWAEYLPLCTLDTAPERPYIEPGTFPEITQTAPVPRIVTSKTESGNYIVAITPIDGDDSNDTTEIYYTTDGTIPSVASGKATKYTDPFLVEENYDVRAICAKDGYLDSTIIRGVQVPNISKLNVDDRFYNRITFSWDSLGDKVDGYEITISNYETEEEIETILVDKSKDSYVLDTTNYASGTKLRISVCSYVGTGTNMQLSGACITTSSVREAPLSDIAFTWFVRTWNNTNCLAIHFESDYVLHHYLKENGVNPYETGADMPEMDGVENFYLFNPQFAPYDKEGYVVVTDKDMTKAWQEPGVLVGGAFKAPVLQAIPDVVFSSTGQTATLTATITNPMENFDYRYQWYVADTEDGEAVAIENATNATYVASVDADEIKYYFCRVTCEYGETMYVDTNNGNEKRTKISGSMVDAEIAIAPIENQTYTSNAITPEVVVTINGATLTKGEDYTVLYTDNINAGTARVVVSFCGDYTGTKTTTFQIVPAGVKSEFVATIPDQVYTSSKVTPELVITGLNGKVLEKGTDYTVSFGENLNVGQASVHINFIKNYSGTIHTAFQIKPKTLSAANIVAEDQIYTGKVVPHKLVVTDGKFTLIEGKDYEVIYAENAERVNVGTVTATVKFINNYTGTAEITYKILQKSAESLDITAEDQEYTGDTVITDILVMDGELELVEDTDYDVVYTNNIELSTEEVSAMATLTFKGNYTGTRTVKFKIMPRNAEHCKVKFEIPNQVYSYTGQKIEPAVIVTDGDKVLVKGTDYTVTYDYDKNVGNKTVQVDFMGNYVGTQIIEFSIISKSITAADLILEGLEDIQEFIYNGLEHTPEITIKDKSLGELLRQGVDYAIEFANNIMAGMATIKIEFLSGGNYIGKTIERFFTIKARTTEHVVISDIPEQRYTGNAITPELEIKDTEANVTLVKDQDYTVEYKNNVKEGIATVVVSFKGNFVGDPMTKTFTIINPVPTTITSNSFHVNQSNGYISKVTVGTTANALRSGLNEKDYVVIYDKNGAVVSGSTVIGTGMTAVIMDEGTTVKRYTIVVTGDTNGDGKINITDMIAVKACTLKKSGLSGAYEKAGDVNGDGKINITDFIKVKATTLKKDTITGVEVK